MRSNGAPTTAGNNIRETSGTWALDRRLTPFWRDTAVDPSDGSRTAGPNAPATTRGHRRRRTRRAPAVTRSRRSRDPFRLSATAPSVRRLFLSPPLRSVFAASRTIGRAKAVRRGTGISRAASAHIGEMTRCSRSASAPPSAPPPRSLVDFDSRPSSCPFASWRRFCRWEIAPGARDRDRGEIFRRTCSRRWRRCSAGRAGPMRIRGIGLTRLATPRDRGVGRATRSSHDALRQISLVR